MWSTMGCLSVVKNNEVINFAGSILELEKYIPSEVTETQTDKSLKFVCLFKLEAPSSKYSGVNIYPGIISETRKAKRYHCWSREMGEP